MKIFFFYVLSYTILNDVNKELKMIHITSPKCFSNNTKKSFYEIFFKAF